MIHMAPLYPSKDNLVVFFALNVLEDAVRQRWTVRLPLLLLSEHCSMSPC